MKSLTKCGIPRDNKTVITRDWRDWRKWGRFMSKDAKYQICRMKKCRDTMCKTNIANNIVLYLEFELKVYTLYDLIPQKRKNWVTMRDDGCVNLL
jgi:hypothetical protein